MLAMAVMNPLQGNVFFLSSILLMKVEALKTRESARIMANFLRQTNPAIAKALVDERDEVEPQKHLVLPANKVTAEEPVACRMAPPL